MPRGYGNSRRDRLGALFTLVLAAILVGLVASAEPPQVDRARSIGSRVSCPVCVGETIRDSQAGIAQDMMVLVEDFLEQGYSDQQVVDQLLAAYPGSSLLDPGFSWLSLWLWAVPVLGLGVGGVLVWRARRPKPVSNSSVPSLR